MVAFKQDLQEISFPGLEGLHVCNGSPFRSRGTILITRLGRVVCGELTIIERKSRRHCIRQRRTGSRSCRPVAAG